MSTLWTPSGEHEVPRPGPAPGGSGQPTSGGGGGGAPRAGSDSRGPAYADDDEPTEEQLREVARQLAAAPPEDVIANHCYGLFELAALHLSQQPPHLPQASLAIDALTLLVEGLGPRLGPHLASLSEGLNQLRLAFVQISDTLAPGD